MRAFTLVAIVLVSFALAQGQPGTAAPGAPTPEAGATTQAPGAATTADTTPNTTPNTPADTPVGATGTDPAALADGAVNSWLERKPIGLGDLSSMDTTQLCRALPGLVTQPAPPEGTRVNMGDRQEQKVDGAGSKRYTYSAVRPGDQLAVVQVDLSRQGQSWRVDKVGFRDTLQPGGVRLWLQGGTASWAFVLFTLLIAYLLVTRSVLRRWLREGWRNIREHRRLVIGTMVFLYGMFALGAWVGASLPQACEEAVVSVVTTAVTSLGATSAYGSGDIVRAAVTTFYQNFVVVTLSITFTLALLFGVPAYLLSAASYFVQGIPFGLLGTSTPLQLALVILLLVIELTSYFVVVAGGGMFLATLVRKGFGSLGEAFRKLTLTLPIAMILLLFGAWYEAFVVLRLGG